MFRFVESICIKNGRVELLDLHQERVNRTFETNYKNSTPHRLIELIENAEYSQEGKYKCRFLYNSSACNIDCQMYSAKAIHTLKIVWGGEVSYPFKTIRRSHLTRLFEQRGPCDDVLIVSATGEVMDSYYANLAFYDGSQWITPNTFLLQGVKRQSLINNGQLAVQSIKVDDIAKFEKVSLINAMLGLGEVEIPIEKVFK